MLLLCGSVRENSPRSRVGKPGRGFTRRANNRGPGVLYPASADRVYRTPQRREPDAHPAPLSQPPASLLSLPQFGSGIPLQLRLEGEYTQDSKHRQAEIAKRLLALGVLEETDWVRNLNRSIVAGLHRWALALGADRFTVLNYNLMVTDDLKAFYIEYGFDTTFTSHEMLGAFALEATDYDEVFLERGVRNWSR